MNICSLFLDLQKKLTINNYKYGFRIPFKAFETLSKHITGNDDV